MSKFSIYTSLIIILLCYWGSNSYAQTDCPPDEAYIIIEIEGDAYSETENSWEILTLDGEVLLEGDYTGFEGCVSSVDCQIIRINDTYGDGIYDPGGATITVDGNILADKPDFSYTFEVVFGGCQAGFACSDAIETEEGAQVSEVSGQWFSFTPTQNGQYLLSTCEEGNSCGTEIVIYEVCEGLTTNSETEGFTYFSDSACDSEDNQASLSAMMVAGNEYFIRINSTDEDCTEVLNWLLEYQGPIVGCMDETACNYNPLASVDDPDDCIYIGDPNCNGPDLIVMQEDIINSFDLQTYDNNDGCFIEEGCMNGYGLREIIRFTTRIENIGDLDYYIGPPPASQSDPSTQFIYDPCHSHWHYKGYAEYVVFNEEGQEIPVGFKAGFCVMDLNCSYGGGTAQYGCGNMGISAQCGDIYSASLDCQWIDISGLPAGLYTLVVRVNWDQDPDVLGHEETDYMNNWTQVCFDLQRNANGDAIAANLIDDCEPYTDCTGQLFGSAQLDCEGVCNGASVMGDLNTDGSQGTTDAINYLQSILNNDIEATPCNDLNGDGEITITDPALLLGCSLNLMGDHNHPSGTTADHNHCNFPFGVTNPFDTTRLQIMDVNLVDRYFDIHIKNPDNFVLAYEFSIEGITISNIESIYESANDYSINLDFNDSGKILGMPFTESFIIKNLDYVPFLRVYYNAPSTATTVCINEIKAILNGNYEEVLHGIEGECVEIEGFNVGADNIQKLEIAIVPNPFDQYTTVHLNNPNQQNYELSLQHINGQEIQHFQTNEAAIQIPRDNLAAGLYLLHITQQNQSYTTKVVIQ